MGLSNAGQCFQKIIDSVLDGMDNIFCYLDDILVFNSSKKAHLDTLDELFKRLNEAGLVALSKCQFIVKEIEFLGYRVNKDGIQPLQSRVKAISECPKPRKQKKLLRYSGMLNYYRHCYQKKPVRSERETLQRFFSVYIPWLHRNCR